MFNGTIFVS